MYKDSGGRPEDQEVTVLEIIEVMPIRLRGCAILRKALLAGEFRAGEELS